MISARDQIAKVQCIVLADSKGEAGPPTPPKNGKKGGQHACPISNGPLLVPVGDC